MIVLVHGIQVCGMRDASLFLLQLLLVRLCGTPIALLHRYAAVAVVR